MPFAYGPFRQRINWKLGAVAAVLLGVVVAGAILAGGVDVPILSEATRSFDYRLQYWRATLPMIAHFPLRGVGPGNFQDYYTQFKLPEASEEVGDPHNFVLEVWATAGTVAFLALVAVLAVVGWTTWKLCRIATLASLMMSAMSSSRWRCRQAHRSTAERSSARRVGT